MKKIITVLACLVFFIIISGSASAVSCGEAVTEDTTLKSDLICTTGNGIIIGGDGITLDGAGHTIISGTGAGIQLVSRKDVTIKNLNIKNSVYGIVFKISQDNTIKDTIISNNDYGVMFDLSSNNNIHNNYFNNTNNFYLQGSSNDWSIIKKEGTNVVGGPWKGGNFWARPDGSGFSETCTDDDGDRICDQIFELDNLNADDFPLIYPNQTLLSKSIRKYVVIIILLLLAGAAYLLIQKGKKEETPF